MLSFILILVCSLFFPGVISRTKSLCAGRKGPGIFQPLRDVWVLFNKGSVFSTTSSYIFQIAPTITFATILFAAFIVPFSNHEAIFGFQGDFVFFSYLIALGRFFLIIGALDVGSGFEGMGANREALYSMLVEPAFFVLMGSLAMATGHSSFADLFSSFVYTQNNVYIIAALSIYLLIQISIVENSRLPVDDPKTHLELTMVHEVMVLDNSGFDMALTHISSMLKFAIFGTLVTNVIVSPYWNLPLQLLCLLCVQLVFAVIIGFQESFRARNKMIKNPQFLLTLTSIALLIFVVMLTLKYKLV